MNAHTFNRRRIIADAQSRAFRSNDLPLALRALALWRKVYVPNRVKREHLYGTGTSNGRETERGNDYRNLRGKS